MLELDGTFLKISSILSSSTLIPVFPSITDIFSDAKPNFSSTGSEFNFSEISFIISFNLVASKVVLSSNFLGFFNNSFNVFILSSSVPCLPILNASLMTSS